MPFLCHSPFLQAAAAAMADREASLSVSTETATTSTSRSAIGQAADSTARVQQTQTPAVVGTSIDTRNAGVPSGGTPSSSLAQTAETKVGVETDRTAAVEEVSGAVVPNRLAAAGPLQHVAPRPVAAAAEEATEQQQLLHNGQQQHAVAAAATQTAPSSEEVAVAAAPTTEIRPAAPAVATAVAGGVQPAGAVRSAETVQHTTSDSATQTADAGVVGVAAQPPAAGAVLESAEKGRRRSREHRAAASPGDKLQPPQQQQTAVETKPLPPGPLALAGEEAAAPAGPTDAAAVTTAASKGKVSTSTSTAVAPKAARQLDQRLQQVEPDTRAAGMRGESAPQHAAGSRDDAVGSARQQAPRGEVPSALPVASAARPEAEAGGEPAAPGSVVSMTSSGRSSQRRHRSWLKHFQPQKQKPEVRVDCEAGKCVISTGLGLCRAAVWVWGFRGLHAWCMVDDRHLITAAVAGRIVCWLWAVFKL